MESIAAPFVPRPHGNAQAEPGVPIQYTTTRSIEVNREVLRRHRLIAGETPGPYVDAYKVLRTKVLQILREHGWNVLAVTSPNPQVGKTVAAINLALSLALDISQTVLLVDANLRHPSIHTAFGLTPREGLADYLLDDVPIERLLINPKGIGRFVILPGSRPLPNSAELLASPKMERLVDELKHRYPARIVVFDLPHLTTADTLAFAPYVDAALLVLEAGRTTQTQLVEALAHLNTTPLLGTVLNKAEPMPNS